MTWQRVINRNHLRGGSYSDPGEHRSRFNLDQLELYKEGQLQEAMWPHVIKRLREYEGVFQNILGDLRRLETDACDERDQCILIAKRIGVEPDIVAVVLKEFFTI